MLSAGFLGSAYWSLAKTPIPYPLPFGSSVSAFTLVADNGSSVASSLLLLMDSCSKGFQLRLPVTSFSPRFTIEVTILLCGGDAVTTAPVGRDFHPHGYQVFKVLSNRYDRLSE
jgi:hypothetical protein